MTIFLVVAGVLLSASIVITIWANMVYDPNCFNFPFCFPVILLQILGSIALVLGTMAYVDDNWEKYLVSEKHAWYGGHGDADGNTPDDKQIMFILKDFPEDE